MKNEAINDILCSIQHWRMSTTLGWQDIKLKYKRSSIGPFWITISMAVTIYTIGFLYGHLFKVDIKEYFPHLASGIIGWTFISTSLIESTNIFVESENYIKNAETHYTVFMMRLMIRNIIIFLHNIIAYLPIFFLLKIIPGFNIFLLIPAIFIVSLNVVLWGTVLAILGTRFRDLLPIITSLIQVAFFMTPIMWIPNFLPEKYQWFILYNPFNQFLNLLRNPLLNKPIDQWSIMIVLLVSLTGFLFFSHFINKYKTRIVFWL